MEPVKEMQVRGIPVVIYKKSLHFSKNYFNTINRYKDKIKSQMALDAALEYLLTSEKLPHKEREGIQRFTVYNTNYIIALHCRWAPTIFRMRDEIFQDIGWYPFVTGIDLAESNISQKTDAWLGDRNFNALEFPNFKVEKITLEDVCSGNGIALILHLNDLKILLDCCFNIGDLTNCPLEDPPDLLYISHAHRDHFGTLQTFIDQFEGIPLICSYTTLDLLSYFNKRSNTLQKNLRELAYPLIFNDIYRINDAISFQILKAGHYPGASMLYLFTPQHRLLYTGDVCLYDLQPLKGSGSGIHNLNGPLHSLIIEGRFCNMNFPSQKLMLDKACEKAMDALQRGAPVLVLGDPGSWLLIFYLKFFYYISQLNRKYRVYLDAHTLEIMKILRYRKEDITPFLAQEILRLHDPFASISKQDLATFDFANHSPDEPPILLIDSNKYQDPPPDYISYIFDNPNALLIITGPIRSDALYELWSSRNYNLSTPKPVSCEIFGHLDNPKHPKFSLHADRTQLLEIFRHLIPPHIYLFHNNPNYLQGFQNYFEKWQRRWYQHTQIHALQPNAFYNLYDINTEAVPIPDPEEIYSRFMPLIKTLEAAHEKGLSKVGLSRLSQLISPKFPYWKETAEVSKISEYVTEAAAADLIELDQSKPEIVVKLKNK